jgi:hypothetical protein
MAVAHGRYKFVTASLLKRLRSGLFTPETRRFQMQQRPPGPRSGLIRPLELPESFIIDKIFFEVEAETTGMAIGACIK